MRKVCRYVDELGRVKARIADLESEEAKLRQCLIDSGMPLVEGKLFRATVSDTSFTEVNYKAVVASLPKSRQLTRLCRKFQDTVDRTTVRVVAR